MIDNKQLLVNLFNHFRLETTPKMLFIFFTTTHNLLHDYFLKFNAYLTLYIVLKVFYI